jgi:hypothetical protein
MRSELVALPGQAMSRQQAKLVVSQAQATLLLFPQHMAAAAPGAVAVPRRYRHREEEASMDFLPATTDQAAAVAFPTLVQQFPAVAQDLPA